MHIFKTTVSTLAITLLAGSAAYAADVAATAKIETSKENPAPAVAAAKGTDKDGNVKFQNDAYITITGTVGNIVEDDEFQLNHAGGTITVDTNDAWPDLFRADAGTVLNTGDRVSVTGKVDNNLFSGNEIEAYRLTVSGDTYGRIYTNQNYAPSYENDYAAYNNVAYGTGLTDDQQVRISGEVSKIVSEDKFMLRYGNGEIQIDTDDVDFTNVSKLTVGDEVVVFGEVDKDLFQKKEVEAERVILSRAYSQIAR